jgi:abequosyltransferase
MSKPILSICIPTYNRCIYLKRLLDSMIPQLDGSSLIEVCITDNASTDGTYDICTDYSARYSFIKYVRQNDNLGPDVNIHAAYSLGSGRYVWIFGDDDYLRVGAIDKILGVISKSNNIDMISMGVLPHGSNKVSSDVSYPVEIFAFEDNAEFSSRVGIMFTFISGLIINKQKIEQYDVSPYVGTCLVQLSWVFRLLRNGNNFIQIQTPLVIAEENNSGGYRFFEVFSVNLSNIVNELLGTGIPGKKVRLSAIKFLLLNVAINGSIHTNYEKENYTSVVKAGFGDLFEYKLFYQWLFKFPFILRGFRMMKNTIKAIIIRTRRT